MIGNELNPINASTNIDDVATRDNINIVLDKVTSDTFLTPYIGLERVSKALAYYHIFLPKMTFLEEERGYKLFKASQFGDKMGMTNDGQVVMNDNPEYSVYFEWNKNYNGVYDIFCQIADHNEVNELISDFEDDIEEDYEDEDEDEDEEYNQELDEDKNNSFKIGEHPVDPMMAGFIDGKKRKRKTVLVVVKKPKTEAGKKAKKVGGGVFRLPKRKYDPTKYDPVSEQKESEQLDEISEEKVRVSHNGKMVVGTVRRRDPGNNKMGILPFHVVDVGDKSGSIKVPNHKVKKLDEKLNKSDPTSKWISDFVKSDDPKFEGKSKKERIKMALGAYYAAQRNEEAEQIEEGPGARWKQGATEDEMEKRRTDNIDPLMQKQNYLYGPDGRAGIESRQKSNVKNPKAQAKRAKNEFNAYSKTAQRWFPHEKMDPKRLPEENLSEISQELVARFVATATKDNKNRRRRLERKQQKTWKKQSRGGNFSSTTLNDPKYQADLKKLKKREKFIRVAAEKGRSDLPLNVYATQPKKKNTIKRLREAEQIEEAATIVRGLGEIVSALKRGIPHEEIAKKHGVHPDTIKSIKSLHDNLEATQKTFPNVKHFTSKGHPDWKKHGIDEASWHQQKSGVNPRHPDSWAVHHNPPGEHASSILFKKKEEAEAHIKAQKEAGRGEHLYLLPPRKPMSEARKTFAGYARKSFGNKENLERIKAEIEANRKKHKEMMKKSASVTPKD